MNKTRYIIAVALLVLVLALAGCTKTWSVKFNQSTNLDAWVQQDWYTPYTLTLYPNGLFLNGKILIGPYGFDGDFAVTYTFETSCGLGYTIPTIQLFFSDGGYASPSTYLSIHFDDVGDPSLESHIIDKTGLTALLVGGEIPFINRIGLNTLSIVKTGNYFEFKLNGSTLLSQFITSLGFDYFFPYLYAVTQDSTQLRIKSISYQYDGNKITRP